MPTSSHNLGDVPPSFIPCKVLNIMTQSLWLSIWGSSPDFQVIFFQRLIHYWWFFVDSPFRCCCSNFQSSCLFMTYRNQYFLINFWSYPVAFHPREYFSVVVMSFIFIVTLSEGITSIARALLSSYLHLNFFPIIVNFPSKTIFIHWAC